MIRGIIAGVIIVPIALIVILAGMMGFINLGGIFNFASGDDPGDPGNANVTASRYTNLGLSNREIHVIISLLTNSSPPFGEHSIFIEGLHMQGWGLDGTTAYSVLQDYEEAYLEDDYTSYTTGVKRGVGWTAFAEVWYNDVGMGRGLTVGDGSYIYGAYGYDVVLLTSYGSILDYYDYITFLSRY